MIKPFVAIHVKQVNAVTAALAQILRPVRFQGDDVRERLVLLRIDVDLRKATPCIAKTYHRQWLGEVEYRHLLRLGIRMVVLEER